MYITICETDDQCKMHEAEHPKPVLWANPEGYGGEGDERGVQHGGKHLYLWLIHVNVWQEPSQYCKLTILQLKLMN